MFLATFRDPLGELNYLHIWHTNTGRSPSWYLSRVVVHDLNNDKKYLFICEGWLAVEEGDGTVDRYLRFMLSLSLSFCYLNWINKGGLTYFRVLCLLYKY